MTGWQRFRKGLGSKPTFKSKGARDSVTLTTELFTFTKTSSGGYLLALGTKTRNLGVLKVQVHREMQVPKMLVISRKADRWYVSFCFEDQRIIGAQSREPTHSTRHTKLLVSSPVNSALSKSSYPVLSVLRPALQSLRKKASCYV